MATGMIRPATPADAPRLLTLHRAAILALAEDPEGPYDQAVLLNWASPATGDAVSLMARSIEEVAEHAFVAEALPATLGWFSLTPEGNHVRAFYVAPEFTRRGIGQAMMAVAAAASRSLGNDVLTIHASLNAVPFYRAQGFVGDDLVAVPLAEEAAIDAVAMTLTLPDDG